MTPSLMRLVLALAILTPSSVAGALPKAENVPGGIALVDLGVAKNRGNPPRAWLPPKRAAG